MENKPSIHNRDDDALDGSTVQRLTIPGAMSVGSTSWATPLSAASSATPETVALPSIPQLADDAKTVIRKVESDSVDKAVSDRKNASPATVAGVLLGTRLNHFLLEEMIGGGGMGAVFRARDDRLDRTVAIKVIPFVGADQDLQRRFRNEAQNAARLDHPYIARVFDVGQFEQWHYIVFEHVEGINLRDMVARDGVLSIDDAVYYTRQIAEAIEHANGRGIVHRDIKPSNVLVGVDGNVKVVDMGLARSQQVEVSGDMTASGVTLGTFDYISPEQARDPRDADVRSDIYSLGCTLYYLLTASPPYPGGTMLQKLLSHGNAPPPDPRGLRPEVSDNLTAIIHKMLAKDPAARYPRAIDVVADLRELAIREGLVRAQSRGTLTITSTDPVPRFLLRHLPWMIAAVLILAIGVGLQISSEVSRNQFQIISRNQFQIIRPTNTGLNDQTGGFGTDRDDVSVNTRNDEIVATNSSDSSPLTPATAVPMPTNPVDDEATVPPLFTSVATPTVSLNASPRIEPSSSVPTASDVQVERIIVGDDSSDPAARSVATLPEAIRLADELKVNVIEIARPVITSPPIQIGRNGLTIRSAVGSSEIRFVTGETLSMQKVCMIDVGSNNIDLQNLHLSWNVRGSTMDGGTLFRIASDNHFVRLANSTITIENLIEREEVYAFEIANSDGYSMPLNTAMVPPAVPFTNPITPSTVAVSGVPPMVAIELENVSARGEMTFINIVDTAQLQFKWQNGLLAVSHRMLEVAGATVRPQMGNNQIQISLNHVTAWAQEGLVRMRLSQSRAYPMMIDRKSSQSAFHSDSGENHIEFDGLESVESVGSDPGQYIQLRGEDNAYDFEPARDASVLRLSQWNGQSRTFSISDILAPEKPSWVSDQSLQRAVHWNKPVPTDITPSRLNTSDFIQDGTLGSGFDKNQLPAFPDRPVNETPI